jgi:predicted GH43/DUF377 family glycosyl hydrolase
VAQRDKKERISVMEWINRKRIFKPSGEFGWMNSHAQIPTVLDMGDKLRVYFSSRPKAGLSMTGFMDVDREQPDKILNIHEKQILEVGPIGSFDGHGIMPQYVCFNGDEVWMYYSGWDRRVDIPYSNWTGLAISKDGGVTFEKAFAGPVVDRTPDEVYSATGCYILRDDDGWHMWYASGVEWTEIEGHFEEYYVIKYAHSDDGVSWTRENRQLLPPEEPRRPTHRPSVIKLGDEYHLLFCFRGLEDFRDGKNAYRIGHASSTDMLNWTRSDDEAGIVPSGEGWDSNMNAYPYLVQTDTRVFLFYCGNGFGAEGFGYAELRR